jgi:hypothetical protein
MASRPDRFFDGQQQRRREMLMAKWHAATEVGLRLFPEDEAGLATLIDAELRCVAGRAVATGEAFAR